MFIELEFKNFFVLFYEFNNRFYETYSEYVFNFFGIFQMT